MILTNIESFPCLANFLSSIMRFSILFPTHNKLLNTNNFGYLKGISSSFVSQQVHKTFALRVVLRFLDRLNNLLKVSSTSCKKYSGVQDFIAGWIIENN